METEANMNKNKILKLTVLVFYSFKKYYSFEIKRVYNLDNSILCEACKKYFVI